MHMRLNSEIGPTLTEQKHFFKKRNYVFNETISE